MEIGKTYMTTIYKDSGMCLSIPRPLVNLLTANLVVQAILPYMQNPVYLCKILHRTESFINWLKKIGML